MTISESHSTYVDRLEGAVPSGRRYSLRELVDITSIEKLLASYSAANGYPMAMISCPEGELLAGTEIRCLDNRRVCPSSKEFCLTQGQSPVCVDVQPRQPAFERCALGLVHGAIPIVIDQSHIATLLTGGVFFEPPDIARYADQARALGLVVAAVSVSIGKVPVLSEETFRKKLAFLYDMAGMISELGSSTLRAKTAADALAKEIDQREKAQDKINESEEKYRLFMENAGFPIVYLGTDGRLAYANSTASAYIGVPSDALIGKSLFDLLSPEQAQAYWKVVQTRLEKHEGAYIEDQVHLHSGDVWFRSSVHTVRNSRGEPVGIQAVCVDITDRKRAEQELERLRNLLSNIVDLMPSLLVVVDGEGRVTQWNRQAEKATGIASLEAHGRMLSEVFPALTSQMDKVKHAMSTGLPETEDRVAIPSGGEVRLGNVTVYPLTSEADASAVIRVDDVTDRARIEEMVMQSEKMLSIGGLAAGIAHEILNPLSGVLQSLEVITRRLKSELPQNRLAAEACGISVHAIEDYMERRGILSLLYSASESGRRAAKIVDNMLSFSRKSEGQFRLHDLSALLDTTVEIATSDYELVERYNFASVQIVREYQAGVPKVWCEVGKIQQVFFNLIKNSAQALAEDVRAKREPRITLRINTDGKTVRTEVEDNGPGMDESVRRRVFEPYFTTKEVGVGTGLGLSISYFIITENHRGTMSVQSRPGMGAKFIIHLPIRASS